MIIHYCHIVVFTVRVMCTYCITCVVYAKNNVCETRRHCARTSEIIGRRPPLVSESLRPPP